METRIDRDWVKAHLPQRIQEGHKGTFGTLAVVAGCSRFRGAAALASTAALRTGAGLVKLASTERVCAAAAAFEPCCILQPLEEGRDGGLGPKSLPEILNLNATALLAGCGLGNTPDVLMLVLGLLENASCPTLFDADALNVLAGHVQGGVGSRKQGLAFLRAAKQPLVLTPHIGEMARLAGCTAAGVAQDRNGAALEFAKEQGVTVVLKSHRTVIASQDGTLLVYDRPNPGLARGGSGDVLSGIIASLLAQGMEGQNAAGVGVWLHGEAGFLAAERYGARGMLPSDLPGLLGRVWLEL